jgi:adenylosuccinate lyase
MNNPSLNAQYDNPLITRYASPAMSYLFSPDFKFTTWRKLWIALAECQHAMGLSISPEQISEMKAHVNDIDYAAARSHEARTRHDVMAHVLTYGECCPLAKPIIHLGATSAYVGDNTDLIQMRGATALLIQRLTHLIGVLRDFAIKYKDLPTLGFTHFQPAQLTTVGKRASLWLLELSMDMEALIAFHDGIPFLGVKGTTGTQASFLKLFDGNHAAVKELDTRVSQAMGFARLLPVSGQTYTRKIDSNAVATLSGLAQSMHKMANDIRLLQHLKEIEEPFEKEQIGSSAMAYKRNPMRSERLTSLARFLISLCTSPMMTAAEQWFERTLDDSANKRLAIPQAYLAADAMLIIGSNICDGLVVYPKVIERRINEELPFMATENILMDAVTRGGDRQLLHEKIRIHSMEAGRQVKEFGCANDLLKRILDDATFSLTREGLDKIMDLAEFIGRAPQQTAEFIAEVIDPLLEHARRFGSIAQHHLAV